MPILARVDQEDVPQPSAITVSELVKDIFLVMISQLQEKVQAQLIIHQEVNEIGINSKKAMDHTSVCI